MDITGQYDGSLGQSSLLASNAYMQLADVIKRCLTHSMVQDQMIEDQALLCALISPLYALIHLILSVICSIQRGRRQRLFPRYRWLCKVQLGGV